MALNNPKKSGRKSGMSAGKTAQKNTIGNSKKKIQIPFFGAESGTAKQRAAYNSAYKKGFAAGKKAVAKKTSTSKTKRGYNARTTMAQEKSRMMRRRSR